MPALDLEAVDNIGPAINREQWLTEAVKVLRPIVESVMTEEEHWPESIAVSCGWPNRTPGKTIGQCFTKASGNGTVQMFISPKLLQPTEILGTLAHELIHAVDDCKSGHKGRFTRMARAIGLEGKMTSTTIGPHLLPILQTMATALGEYPHSGIQTAGPKVKVGSRLIKMTCSDCETTVRTTAKWLDMWGSQWPCPCEQGRLEEAN